MVVADRRKLSTDQFNYWSPLPTAVAADHRRRRRPGRAGRAARHRCAARSDPSTACAHRYRQPERQPAVTNTSTSTGRHPLRPSHRRDLRQAVLHRPTTCGSSRCPSRIWSPATCCCGWTPRCCAAPTFASIRAASRRTSPSPPCWATSSPAPWSTANGPLPDGVAMGDQVAVYPLVTCGECAACRKGHENICRNRKAFGYQLTGGLSQYVRVPRRGAAEPGAGAGSAGRPGRHHRTGRVRLQRAEARRHAARARPRSSSGAGRSD